MDNNTVPYIAFEAELARMERMARRLFILLIITISLLFGSSMAWLYVFNTYEFTTEEIELDGSTGGNANYIGAGSNGVINNGTGYSQEANGQEEGSEQATEDLDQTQSDN